MEQKHSNIFGTLNGILPNTIKMYSQNQEEIYITNYFQGKLGVFLDIGAYNPFKFSNTRRLYELGWSGTFVEPSPNCFKHFVAEYEKEERVKLINAAVVTNDDKKLSFWDSNGDAVSTSNYEHKEKWTNGGAKYTLIEVDAISTQELEKSLTKPVNFLNLDVEASNYQIFSCLSNEFLLGLDMICIEHDNQINAIMTRMANFKLVYQNGENIILAK